MLAKIKEFMHRILSFNLPQNGNLDTISLVHCGFLVFCYSQLGYSSKQDLGYLKSMDPILKFIRVRFPHIMYKYFRTFLLKAISRCVFK